MSETKVKYDQTAASAQSPVNVHRDGDIPVRAPLEPMDSRLTSIQPGGGVIIKLELAWGRCRRWYLRIFRRKYVARMQQLRRGNFSGCPFEPLDPRDVKVFRNQGGYFWEAVDDPFTWRDRLPFVRVGLAELIVFSVLCFGSACTCVYFASQAVTAVTMLSFWLPAAALVVMGILIAWFFRNPSRTIPVNQGIVLAPADGKIVAVEEVEFDEFVGGPAVMIGIFLSIFDVHVNRVPVAARVIGLKYQPGKYLNALRPESACENEQLAIRIEENSPPYRRMVVRQIAGAIARRIVCWIKPGDELSCGERFGMIKLGSRTELVLPQQKGLDIKVQVGDKVNAGSTIVAKYQKLTS